MKNQGLLQAHMIPMDHGDFTYSFIDLTAQEAVHALQGKKIALAANRVAHADASQTIFRAYSPDERFLGLFEWKSTSQVLVPAKVFL